jgi:hypothetical protein
MKIELREITVRDLVEGYVNNAEEGVSGYGGSLNIRPPYQREFVYKDKQRDAVIETLRKGFPLNTMYWVIGELDGAEAYEVLDGQQRTISICEYVSGSFSIDFQYFFNLLEEEQERILNYKLMVYFCEGTPLEKLGWFETINIAGEKLTDQELRNAIYTGPWLSDAKRYFSKTKCPAYAMGSDYMTGSPIRQDYLETTLDWINDGKIREYMADHQKDANANEIWLYFQSVMNWVKTHFADNYRREMKNVPWGHLYNQFHTNQYDAAALEVEVSKLMRDDDVSSKSGIYQYVFNRNEKHLSIRGFTNSQKREAYERQQGVCPSCVKNNSEKTVFSLPEMEADHITPWSEGGRTSADNCQMLCKPCNRTKSNK